MAVDPVAVGLAVLLEVAADQDADPAARVEAARALLVYAGLLPAE